MPEPQLTARPYPEHIHTLIAALESQLRDWWEKDDRFPNIAPPDFSAWIEEGIDKALDCAAELAEP